jgi:hypothetical protein
MYYSCATLSNQERYMYRSLISLTLIFLISTPSFSQEPVTPVPAKQAPTETHPAPAEQPASAPATAAPATTAPSKPVLQDGTPVKLRLARNVSSADATTGESVDFEVLEEVKISDLLVIPKGGLAIGTVTEAEHKKRLARGGKLNMTIDYVRLVDGEKAALRAVREAKGGGHTGAMTAGIVVTGLIIWPAAPFFLFMHGKDITIPKGTEITAYVNGDSPIDRVKIEAALAPPAPATPATATIKATSAGDKTTLNINTNVPGADIELDGAFVGSTPSSIGVTAGEHVLKITKTGFKSWERKLTVSSGTVQITPELEKETPPTDSQAK